jgi:hypothetical protein
MYSSLKTPLWVPSMAVAEQQITLAEYYAELAQRFHVKAISEKNEGRKDEWERLSNCYVRLAKNAKSRQRSPDRQAT